MHLNYTTLVPVEWIDTLKDSTKELHYADRITISQRIIDSVQLLNGLTEIFDIEPFYMIKSKDWSHYRISFSIKKHYLHLLEESSDEIKLLNKLDSLSSIKNIVLSTSYKFDGNTTLSIRKLYANQILLKDPINEPLGSFKKKLINSITSQKSKQVVQEPVIQEPVKLVQETIEPAQEPVIDEEPPKKRSKYECAIYPGQSHIVTIYYSSHMTLDELSIEHNIQEKNLGRITYSYMTGRYSGDYILDAEKIASRITELNGRMYTVWRDKYYPFMP